MREKGTHRSVLLLHGRGGKPPRQALQQLWLEALRWGLEEARVPEFEACSSRLLYYGDLSNRFLNETGNDIEVRRAVFERLKHADFTRSSGRSGYRIDHPPPDILAYWSRHEAFSKALRERVREELERSLREVEQAILFAHSLGAVVAYDALAALTDLCPRLTLVTLGSPLSLPHFKVQLVPGERPLHAWVNVSARGDFACGPPLEGVRQIDIFNPALRDGLPDPHHALGYLCHPRVGELLGAWLEGATLSESGSPLHG